MRWGQLCGIQLENGTEGELKRNRIPHNLLTTANGETSSVRCPDAIVSPVWCFHLAEGKGSRFRLEINLGVDVGRV